MFHQSTVLDYDEFLGSMHFVCLHTVDLLDQILKQPTQPTSLLLSFYASEIFPSFSSAIWKKGAKETLSTVLFQSSPAIGLHFESGSVK